MMKSTCCKTATQISSVATCWTFDSGNSIAIPQRYASAKRPLRFKNNRTKGHSIDDNFIPPGRASRSETRTVVSVTLPPTEHVQSVRHHPTRHTPQRAYARKSSRLTKRLSSTTAVTGVAAIDLFSGKRWTATPVHRIVLLLYWALGMRTQNIFPDEPYPRSGSSTSLSAVIA